VERLLTLNAHGRDLDLQIWTALSFEMWCRRFLDGAVERSTAQESIGSPVEQSPGPLRATRPTPEAHVGRVPRSGPAALPVAVNSAANQA
jgi:hypothetical protein